MLSEEEMTMFYDCFCVFDSSKRGHINKEKVQCALKTLGFNPKDKQLQRTIFQIDEDSNGRFNFHKFIKIIVALEKEDEEIKSGGLVYASEEWQAVFRKWRNLTRIFSGIEHNLMHKHLMDTV